MQVREVVFVIALTFCFSLSVGLLDIEDNAFIQEIDIGRNAILKCRSNDASHVFLFWHLQKEGVNIGPSNEYDQQKYNYEAVSGNLTIRGVTSKDEGLYNCVSQGITKLDFLSSSVRLVVMKDWEEVFETDSDTNLMRVCAVLGSLLGILIIIYMAMKLRQNYKRDYLHFDDANEEEDDSTEELFNRDPSTSGNKKTVPDNKRSPDDFEKVYTAINMTDNV